MAQPNPTPASPNVISLLRVSKDQQDNLRQRSDMPRLQTRFNLTFARTAELKGVSGTATDEDVQVVQILKDMERPEIDGLALSSLDRLIRPGKRFGQSAMMDVFTQNHKKIYSMREGLIDFDTDEGLDKIWAALGSAGKEWREIKRRSMDQIQARGARGELVSPSVPYGFLYFNKHTPGGKRIELDTRPSGAKGITKAQAAGMIFEWRASGLCPYSISKKLNTLGILSAGYNGQPGGEWSRKIVKQLLARTTYMGIHPNAGNPVACPAIVTRELFEAAQRQNQTGAKWVGRPSAQYLLRNFLWCSKCKRRRTAHRNHGYPQYICGHLDARTYKRLCFEPAVSTAMVERVVWSAVWALLKDPARLLKMGLAAYTAAAAEQDATGELAAQVADLEAQIETTQRMMRKRLIAFSKGEALIVADQERLREIESRQRAQGRVLNLPPLAVAREACERIAQGAEPSTYAEQRPILEGLMDLKVSLGGGEVEIEGSVPMPAAIVSTTSNGKNGKRAIGGAPLSFDPIPFNLKERVA